MFGHRVELEKERTLNYLTHLEEEERDTKFVKKIVNTTLNNYQKRPDDVPFIICNKIQEHK